MSNDLSRRSVLALIPGSAALDTVKQDIAQKVEDGTYQLLFTTDDWVPYQLIQIR